MHDENGVQNSQDGQVGAGLGSMSNLFEERFENGRGTKTYQLRGNAQSQMEESISKIVGFESGYPKRIIIDQKEPGAEAWNGWFEQQYQEICRFHHITPEPKQNVML